MRPRDYRDIVGGGLLIVLGLWVGFYSVANYEVGQLGRMGPGMFPMVLGFLLAGIGALIGAPAMFRPGSLPDVHWRPLAFVTIGTLAFSLTVTRLGMVPAVALLTLMSVFAGTRVRLIHTLILVAALSILAYLIFRLGLGIVLEPFRWRF